MRNAAQRGVDDKGLSYPTKCSMIKDVFKLLI